MAESATSAMASYPPRSGCTSAVIGNGDDSLSLKVSHLPLVLLNVLGFTSNKGVQAGPLATTLKVAT